MLVKPKKDKSLSNDYCDSEAPSEQQIAYFIKNFQKVFRNEKKSQERHRGASKESRKRYQSMRCQKC